jgi:hypothetical protein
VCLTVVGGQQQYSRRPGRPKPTTCRGCGIAGVSGELGEQRPLRTAVAFPEGMQRVDVGEELGEPVDERLPTQSAQVSVAGEAAEHLVGHGHDVLREAEQHPLADRDRADLARPVVDVTEDPLVDRLEVSEVVATGQRTPVQLRDPELGGNYVGTYSGRRNGARITRRLRRMIAQNDARGRAGRDRRGGVPAPDAEAVRSGEP